MRKIRIEDDLRIGFPGRDASFSDGVEIGMLACLMALGSVEFSRTIARENVEQARVLARKLGYHLAAAEDDADGAVRVTLRDRSQKPKLRLVKSG